LPSSGGGILFSGCDSNGLSAKDQLLEKIKAARPNRGDATKEEFKKLYLDNADFVFRNSELSGQDFREIHKERARKRRMG